MPIYEYDCQTCGTFEVSQKMSEPALTTHPACGRPVERRISLTSFALKGGGWYSDGYASTGGKKADSPAPSGGCGAAACGTNGCASA
jgi:putative FmdB family regulatory protein